MTTFELDRAEVAEGLPPGTRMPKALQTAMFLLSRRRLMELSHRRFGDVFTLRIVGSGNVVVVSKPEHIKEVFAGSPSVFRAGEGSFFLRAVFGENSLLILDGDVHTRTRKQLMPVFNGAALRGYGDMMREIAAADADGWPIGRPFAVRTRTNAVNMEIMLRVVIGLTEGERMSEFLPLIDKVSELGQLAMLALAYPRLERLWPWRRNRELLNAVDRVLHAEFAHRRGEPDLAQRGDVLSKLIAADPDISDAALRDHAITFFLAGYETTATALSWTYYELARRPELQRAAQRAADSGDDDYLEAVAKESMRLRTVVQNPPRRLAEPAEVAGHLLPAGTVVAPSIYLVHRDPDVHADPQEFRPERFLGKGPAAGTWIPFGGGVRRCVGAGLATQEVVASLRTVLSRYDLHPASPRPEKAKARNIALAPSRGGRIIATQR